MRGPGGKAEEGVAEGTGPGERCFPNGSRLTLVCGRVEGNPESLSFFFISFIPFFNPPLDGPRGAVTAIPLGQLSVGKLPFKPPMVTMVV